MVDINFNAPPTVARFMGSAAFGRLIAGPVGSGKTTGCVIELLRRAVEQSPAADGLRYTRFAVVRQTLKQLKDTVLKDCKAWLSAAAPLGEWKVSESTFHLNFDTVRSEWIFIPLEDAADQARLLSMQLTGAWLSEAIEMDIDVVAPVSGRCGRYPNGALGVPSWYGIIADTNFPVELSPWWQFMENPLPNWQIFKQPSALSAEAENLEHLLQTSDTQLLPSTGYNLQGDEDGGMWGHPLRRLQGRKYYQSAIDSAIGGIDSDWVNRYVKANYGNDPSGEAVFRATFQPHFHGQDGLSLIPGFPLLIGQDFGRNPWSLICQGDHMGRLLVHEEVPATNVGLEKHITQSLRPKLLGGDYTGYKVAIVGDPSGIAKSNISEESCFDVLKRIGLPCFPAPTNEIEPRLRAVEALLQQQRLGGPCLIINTRRCPMLMRAMSGGYRFKKTPAGALKVVPEKNDPEGFSHVADCLQYVALAVHGGIVEDIARRLRPRNKKIGPRLSPGAWT